MPLLDSQKRGLGVVAKALGLKLGGEEACADQLKSLIPVGPFNEKVVIVAEVRGSRSPDGVTTRFFGVGIDDLFDYAIGALPGFTEDWYRRFSAGVIELKRAELEEREIRDVEYIGSLGVAIILSASEIDDIRQRAEERKARMEADAKSDRFSKLIKVEVPRSGQMNIDYVGLKVRQAKDEDLTRLTCLKQTKQDAKVFGAAKVDEVVKSPDAAA